MAHRLKVYSHFSWEGVKKSPGVWPVLFFIGLGVTMAASYTARLALTCPDVTWCPKKRNEPWQEYENKDYKFVKIEPFDTKNYIHPRPRF